MPYIVKHANAGFHSEIEWNVATDVDLEYSDSSDESDGETSGGSVRKSK